MVSLAERTRRLLKGNQTSRAGEQATIECPCGERVETTREEDYALLTCPRCGTGLFVLPHSPFPSLSPAAPSRRKTKGARAEPEIDSTPRISLGERFSALGRRLTPPRRWFSTPRLVGGAAALFILATIAWQYDQSVKRGLRETVVPDGRRGLQALSDGDFEDAYDLLGASVRGLDRLGEPFPEEDRFRRAYAEVAIVHDLLPSLLDVELVGAASEPEVVTRRVAGKAIVLDAEVERLAEGGWSVGFVAFVDDKPIRLDVPTFLLFDRLGIVNRERVVFGAKLDGIHRDAEGQLTLRLTPNSGVLMTEPRLLDALGLTRNTDAAELNRRQEIFAERLSSSHPEGK